MMRDRTILALVTTASLLLVTGCPGKKATVGQTNSATSAATTNTTTASTTAGTGAGATTGATTGEAPSAAVAGGMHPLLAVVQAKGTPNKPGTEYRLKAADCRTLLKLKATDAVDEDEGCKVQVLAGGKGIVTIRTIVCEGDGCQNEALAHVGSRIIALPKPFYGKVVATPDLGALFYDDTVNGDKILLYRADVASGQTTEHKGCISPTLSPGGKWVICRDVEANVHKMPVAGGPLTLVERSKHKGDVLVRWQFGDFPRPVRFKDDRTLVYDVQVDAGEGEPKRETFEVAWTE